MKTRAGFTLLELLVVIAIVGVLSVIGIVNLPRDRIQVREATRVIVADVNRARSEAIRLNTEVELSFNTTSDCYTISETKNQDGQLLGTPRQVLQRCISADFPLADLSSAAFLNGPRVLFNSRGLPSATGNITVIARGRTNASLRIVMEIQGRLRVEQVS